MPKRLADESRQYLARKLRGGAPKSLPRAAYDGIPEGISRAAFVQSDESAVRMNGGGEGYAWPATTGDAAYPAAAVPGPRPCRGRGRAGAAAVPGPHFGGLLGMPAVTDGYAVYGMLPVRQRRRAHILREAEKHAVRNGGDGLPCCRRLPSTYGRTKYRESAYGAGCPDLKGRAAQRPATERAAGSARRRRTPPRTCSRS